jgi:transcriptional regulator with XRE-family HTH domain
VRTGLLPCHVGRIVQGMTYPTEKEVADYFESARQGQGFTMKKLADITGISPRQVKAKLAGERPLTTADLHRFATAFGTTPGQVYTELEEA